jgi:SagB-type dehydrogenase family enzyme
MPDPAGVDFMRLSRYENMEPTAESRGEPQPPLELPYDPSASLIPLPEPAEISVPAFDLRKAFEARRTGRRYAATPLTLNELAYLLWATQGVQEVTKRPATLRPVPSAGARHAFETYLLVNRVDGLAPGLYRYVALEHALLPVTAGPEKTQEVAHACLDQKQILNSAVTFIWVAVTERMVYRYGQRGYRYLHLDAGHVCQNLYLAGESLDCRTCAIAAFDDGLLNAALGLDGERLFAIYLGSLGKRA